MRKQRIRCAGTEDFEYVLSRYEYDKMTHELAELEQYKQNVSTMGVLYQDCLDELTTPITTLEAAWLALNDITSKSVHLEPRHAEALVAEHNELMMRVEDRRDELKRLQTAYSTLFREHENCNRPAIFMHAHVSPSGGGIDWQARCEQLAGELIAMQTMLDSIGGAGWHENVPWVDDEPTH